MKFHMLYSELKHTKYTCSLLSIFPLELVEYCYGFTWYSCSTFTLSMMKGLNKQNTGINKTSGRRIENANTWQYLSLYADSGHNSDVPNVKYLLNDGDILATLLGKSCYGFNR